MYAGQTVEVQTGSATFLNERQKAAVRVEKQDEETKNPLSGGIYGLYAGSFVMNILKDWDDHDLPEANFVSISQLKCKRFPVRCNHRILPEEF